LFKIFKSIFSFSKCPFRCFANYQAVQWEKVDRHL
jgi:hypothetical protein